MKYLIDTNVFLWIITDSDKLSKKAAKCFLENKNQIYLSIASVWELAIKKSIGKINLESPFAKFINNSLLENRISILNINISHICYLESMPLFHRDPFDRLIISQSICEKMPLVCSDTNFLQYPVNRIW
jgi:PIN domain nuclease of toxin-antitoxin system